MSDPLNPWEQKDRLEPSGDLSPEVEGLTGIMNTVGAGLQAGGAGAPFPDEGTAEREAADARRAAAGGVGDTDPAPDANDLEADNAVEQETIDSVDPRNAPA